MQQVFILGAGLGTRLRPLTDRLPKPLVPLFHQPLAAWAVAACRAAGIRRFAINTHHLPDAWENFIRLPEHAGLDITLFHEPVLLETGGGLKNIAAWVGDQPLLVHNGDIFSNLPLPKLIATHRAGGRPVTLALRSGGGDKRVAIDSTQSLVTDLRHELGVAEGTHVFSGIYCMEPAFLELLPQGEVVSVIPAFLELARRGELGAVVIDDGEWLDLGDRDAYLKAHRELALAPRVHPSAKLARGSVVLDSVIGPAATVGESASVSGSVLWPGTRVMPNATLENCIVFSGRPVSGTHKNANL